MYEHVSLCNVCMHAFLFVYEYVYECMYVFMYFYMFVCKKGVFSPLYDCFGDCIVDDHGRLRGPPQSHSRPGAEDRLGEPRDELAERLSDESEYIRSSGVEKILAMHGVQDLLQRFLFREIVCKADSFSKYVGVTVCLSLMDE